MLATSRIPQNSTPCLIESSGGGEKSDGIIAKRGRPVSDPTRAASRRRPLDQPDRRLDPPRLVRMGLAGGGRAGRDCVDAGGGGLRRALAAVAGAAAVWAGKW